MAGRDDFSSAVRNALALRAAYRCSICDRSTVGPSDQSSMATSSIGTAAHICAAAPGGPRYDADMSSNERSGIDNGIWLCANDGRLIDTDVVTYTAEVLKSFKANHEAKCKQALLSGTKTGVNKSYLVAIGPNIVGLGSLEQVDGNRWQLGIEHFVIGSFAELVTLAGDLGAMPAYDRYVLVNGLGTGRALAGDISIRRDGAQVMVRCQVAPSFPCIAASQLPMDLALSQAFDLMTEGGNIATVSGLAALPQKLITCLSMRRGESPFHQDFGSRLAEYWRNYLDSPWLEELLKLDIIRLASIPYADTLQRKSYTPLMCVERVVRVSVIGQLTDRRLPIRLDLEVAGVGAWSRDIAVHVG